MESRGTGKCVGTKWRREWDLEVSSSKSPLLRNLGGGRVTSRGRHPQLMVATSLSLLVSRSGTPWLRGTAALLL